MAKSNQVSSHSTLPSISNHARYFSLPCIVFLLLDLSTTGWCRGYWFYANWKAVKQAEKSNISSFWRSMFAFLYVKELFEYIAKQANQNEYKTIHSKRYAVIYIILTVLQIIFYPIVAIFFSLLFVLQSTVQKNEQMVMQMNVAIIILFILFLLKNFTC